MPGTQIDVVNIAAFELGSVPLQSIDDNTKIARTAKARYSNTRDALLRQAPWKFSIKRTALTADIAVPAYGYSAQYQVPSDCVRILEVGNFPPMSGWNVALTAFDTDIYRFEGRKILINTSGTLNLRYVSNDVDESLWDASFVELMGLQLAFDMCEAVTQSSQKKNDIRVKRDEAKRTAKQIGSIEQPPQEMQDDSWWVSRF